MGLSEHVEAWLKAYYPCSNGVHVFDPDDEEFGGRTVKNFDVQELSVFQELSSAGKGQDYDLICDLIVNDNIEDQCTIRRQDLALIERRLSEDPRP